MFYYILIIYLYAYYLNFYFCYIFLLSYNLILNLRDNTFIFIVYLLFTRYIQNCYNVKFCYNEKFHYMVFTDNSCDKMWSCICVENEPDLILGQTYLQ